MVGEINGNNGHLSVIISALIDHLRPLCQAISSSEAIHEASQVVPVGGELGGGCDSIIITACGGNNVVWQLWSGGKQLGQPGLASARCIAVRLGCYVEITYGLFKCAHVCLSVCFCICRDVWGSDVEVLLKEADEAAASTSW